MNWSDPGKVFLEGLDTGAGRKAGSFGGVVIVDHSDVLGDASFVDFGGFLHVEMVDGGDVNVDGVGDVDKVGESETASGGLGDQSKATSGDARKHHRGVVHSPSMGFVRRHVV